MIVPACDLVESVLWTSLFESVPSVEYKQLDEEKSQGSLEDLTVSLNDPKSAKINKQGINNAK